MFRSIHCTMLQSMHCWRCHEEGLHQERSSCTVKILSNFSGFQNIVGEPAARRELLYPDHDDCCMKIRVLLIGEWTIRIFLSSYNCVLLRFSWGQESSGRPASDTAKLDPRSPDLLKKFHLLQSFSSAAKFWSAEKLSSAAKVSAKSPELFQKCTLFHANSFYS